MVWRCAARRRSVTSRKISTAPASEPSKLRMGAPESSIGSSLSSRVTSRAPDSSRVVERLTACLVDDAENLPDRLAACVRERPARQLLGDLVEQKYAARRVGGDH